MDYQDNELCEICMAYSDSVDSLLPIIDIYIINTHCIELRRNREARKNKNVKPTNSVF